MRFGGYDDPRRKRRRRERHRLYEGSGLPGNANIYGEPEIPPEFRETQTPTEKVIKRVTVGTLSAVITATALYLVCSGAYYLVPEDAKVPVLDDFLLNGENVESWLQTLRERMGV